jgi:methionyl aminopeptidase
MIELKSRREIEKIAASCRIVARALALAEELVQPGVRTLEIDEKMRNLIEKEGAKPSFLGYRGYPASTCISINEVIVHGIPNGRRIEEGDLVSVDVGAYLRGFHGDAARTFLVGDVDQEKRTITEAVRESLRQGIAEARPGAHVGDISAAVQRHAEGQGFSVVRSLVGHGIGREMHEEPQVPNFGDAGSGPLLKEGMTIAIEPMLNAGTWETETLADGWTIVTADRRVSAHWENTIVITADGAEVLTVS